MCSYCRCSFEFTPRRGRFPGMSGLSCSGPELGHADPARAGRAAEHVSLGVLDPVADDVGAAVVAPRREEMDRALEAVERMSAPPGVDRHGLVVVVAADVTSRHPGTPRYR